MRHTAAFSISVASKPIHNPSMRRPYSDKLMRFPKPLIHTIIQRGDNRERVEGIPGIVCILAFIILYHHGVPIISVKGVAAETVPKPYHSVTHNGYSPHNPSIPVELMNPK